MESLFNTSHIDKRNPLKLAVLAMYIPIGLVVLVFRLSLFVVVTVLVTVAGVNPSPWALRLLCLPFGVLVTAGGPGLARMEASSEEGASEGKKRKWIVTPNHVSAFDVVPLRCLFRTRTLMDKSFFSLVRGNWAEVVGAVWVDRSKPREVVRREVSEGLEKGGSRGGPVVVFPEGWDTSGRVGLLRFNKGIFESSSATVVPCAIEVRVCMDWMLPLVPGALGVALWSELAWLFFQPGLSYRVTFLEPFETPDSAPEALERAAGNADRAQRSIAAHLGIKATAFTNKDTLKWRQELMAKKKNS